MAEDDGVYNESERVTVLGMCWGEGDTLGYQREIKWDGCETKRSTLSYTNAMFDPLNLLVPIAVMCRGFLRVLWSLKLSWDQSFPKETELSERFSYLRKQVDRCLELQIPASVVVYPNTEIYVFGDASKSAYGAVLYLVTPPCDKCDKGEVKLLMAKVKLIPPIKSQNPKEDTIPRWELASLVLAGHLVHFVMKDMEELAHCPVYIWGGQ